MFFARCAISAAALSPISRSRIFRFRRMGRRRRSADIHQQTDLPLTIGLLVDVSGSQRNLIEVERRAAYQFFSQVLHKKDMAFLISFGAESELLQDLTGSPK